MPRIIVVVMPLGQNGSDVFDAEPRMMLPKDANRWIPGASDRMKVPEPHLSFSTEMAAQQRAKYAKDVEAMAKKKIPVRIFHGKTSSEEGYYIVTGEKAGRIKLCLQDGQTGVWSNRPDYGWDGPHLTLDEAKDKMAQEPTKPKKAVTA